MGASLPVDTNWLKSVGIYFGQGKMDQTAQGERFKGKFNTNYLVFI
jgi:hypothetical protein